MRLSVLALLLCPLLAGAQDRVCVRLIVEERQQEHPDRAGFAGGSATAIAPDLLLTCAHVVDHALMVVVADGDRRLVADGWEIHAGWAARTPGAKEDPLCDLAVVRVPGAKFTPARLADSDPKPGVELWQWGHPALAIKPVRKAGTVLPFKATGKEATTPKTYAFSGFVKDIQINFPVAGAQESTVTIKPTGAITVT